MSKMGHFEVFDHFGSILRHMFNAYCRYLFRDAHWISIPFVVEFRSRSFTELSWKGRVNKTSELWTTLISFFFLRTERHLSSRKLYATANSIVFYRFKVLIHEIFQKFTKIALKIVNILNFDYFVEYKTIYL